MKDKIQDVFTTSDPFEIISKDDGIKRFKSNNIIRDLLDFSKAKGFGLNEIALKVQENYYSIDEMKVLYKLIGYSLYGFEEIFAQEEE